MIRTLLPVVVSYSKPESLFHTYLYSAKMHSFLVAVVLAELVFAFPSTQPSMNETIYKRVPPMSFACDDLPGMSFAVES